MPNDLTMYGKTLAKKANTSVENGLLKASLRIMRVLKQKLFQTTFSDRAKKAFAKNLALEVKPSSLVIHAKHPAFVYFIKGAKKQQMAWLVKSPTPIPIVTETGELIFRRATAKSMANGRWVHPGRKGSNFLKTVKKQVTALVRQAVIEEIKKTSSR